MNIKQHIAQHLIDVHRGGNWTEVSIAEVLKDVSWVEACSITPFSPNSIAMLLHHITYWNRILTMRGRNSNPPIAKDNGMKVAINSEAEWEALKRDNLYSAEELATVIEGYDDSGLFAPILPGKSSAYKTFQGQVEHVHYHLGQMVMLKKYIRNRK
ncbi:hypothetical protein PIECOFPK_00844 [Mycovorax composti]|uniref:DinB-like domain-containing protein n=1 Tax=Mycovorax composti TaxID=2962693 RepID=A0ABZ2EIZ1_9BACT